MTLPERPILDPRDAEKLLEELLERRPAFLPAWIPAPGSGAWAFLHAYTRMLQVVIDRLNLAPEKNKLAFLDMLGINLVPARGSRAPVVFTPLPDGRSVQFPAGSRLGANTVGSKHPLYFETETALTITPAQLTHVFSLQPDQDKYARHEFSGQSVTLFEPLQPVPHELYIAHDKLLDFDGKAEINVAITLSRPAKRPLKLAWEFWDGKDWMSFQPFEARAAGSSWDGTKGLTRSGTVTLHVACGSSEKIDVRGIQAYWMRARIENPLTGWDAESLPQIERIRMRGVIERTVDDAAPPDQAFAEGRQVDLTRAFAPLGHAPRPGSVFYFAAEEAFSRPGAQVTLHFRRVQTAEELADLQSAAFDMVLQPRSDSFLNALKDAAGDFVFGMSPRGTPAEGDVTAAANLLNVDLPTDQLLEKILDLNEKVKAARITPAGSAVSEIALRSFYNISMATWSVVIMSNPDQFAPPKLAWEYWNGASWITLPSGNPGVEQPVWHFLDTSGAGESVLSFPVPDNIAEITYNGRQAHWLRARMAEGSYSRMRVTTYRDNETDYLSVTPILENRPPLIEGLVYNYIYHSPWENAGQCVANNFFRYSEPELVGGNFVEPFQPFLPVAEQAPALYLGFDRSLPNSLISLYFDFEESDQPNPSLVWEAWNGQRWRELVVKDETEHLRLPGIVSFIAPSWAEGRPLLSRFGLARAWIRARLKISGDPPKSKLRAIYTNAAWASQVQTAQNELLGSGTGHPGQVLFFRSTPVLPGEVIEVRELEGPRAEVEYPILRDSLLAAGFPENSMRTEVDPRTGRVRAVWVRWQHRSQLHFSGPDDRHYTVERAQGRIIFNPYRPLPASANNVRAVRYQAGGGQVGNVPAKAITQVLSGVLAQKVANPKAAEGGAEGEALARVMERGPQVIRHRGRSLSTLDFEALAYEASPGIALARALPMTAADGRSAPGWVSIIIIPNNQEPQPQPSYQLRRQVRDYLAARAPASLPPHRITVTGPVYQPIGLSARVVAREIGEAGQVERRVRAAVEALFHPVTGGPDGRGWLFGRDVYLSDLAALVEGLPGIDYAEGMDLLLDGAPVGERAEVPPDRVVAAGPVHVEIVAPR
jgi:hypothetical protein